MRRYGYTMEKLAAKINGSQSSLSQVMSNPSPTLKMLDRIAEGLGCKRWEFFLDEMDLEEVKEKLGIVVLQEQQPQLSEKPKRRTEELSFERILEPETARGVFVCPHCGAGVSFNAFVVKEPKTEDQKEETGYEQK